MTATTDVEPHGPEVEHDGEPVGAPDDVADAPVAEARRWRSVWRIHFYAGVFAMPFIVLMAVTGLVILYTQPIQDLSQRDVRTVTVGEQRVSADDQAAAVATAYPDASVTSMTVGVGESHATSFGIDDGSAAGRQVFVDPYTGEVLGSVNPAGGVVGLSNRLHGTLNNESITIDLPTVSALWDGDAVMRPYVLGDLILELFGIWTMTLVLAGLYLWWPRRGRRTAATSSVLGVRRGVSGRPRWRDLHGLAGVVMAPLLVLTIFSGLLWSTYWGPQAASIADALTPNSWTDAPPSAIGRRGDLDRLGNQLNWNTGDRPIPASYSTPTDGTLPTAMSLDDVVAVAEDERMKPGFTVYFPTNVEGDDGDIVYGAFTVSNSWPRKTSEARDLYLDQFTGDTLAEQDVYGYGAVGRGLDTLVSVHMGTQLGVLNRIVMTLVALLAIFSVISGAVMFWKRRRRGTLGLPRRPTDARMANGAVICAVALAVVFPIWGLTVLAVLAIDHLLIRRVKPLRTAFGQPI
jgi:uncharacterized iron-regulated membrane protein